MDGLLDLRFFFQQRHGRGEVEGFFLFPFVRVGLDGGHARRFVLFMISFGQLPVDTLSVAADDLNEGVRAIGTHIPLAKVDFRHPLERGKGVPIVVDVGIQSDSRGCSFPKGVQVDDLQLQGLRELSFSEGFIVVPELLLGVQGNVVAIEIGVGDGQLICRNAIQSRQPCR